MTFFPHFKISFYFLFLILACLKIDWYKGPGHRLIVGSFTDGTVALWDLMTKSPLLKAPDGLFPLKSFHAHEPGSRPTLALSQDLQSWPRYLVTGGFDRKLIGKNNFIKP